MTFNMNTMTNTKDRQISVRIPAELDAWLQDKAPNGRGKADFVRRLIEQARAREAQRELRSMFDTAAACITAEDRNEREQLAGAFAGNPGVPSTTEDVDP